MAEFIIDADGHVAAAVVWRVIHPIHGSRAAEAFRSVVGGAGRMGRMEVVRCDIVVAVYGKIRHMVIFPILSRSSQRVLPIRHFKESRCFAARKEKANH